MVAAECKICGGVSEFFTAVESGKHCNLQIPAAVSGSGQRVEYYRCLNCDFIFTDFLDAYSILDLKTSIYNDAYVDFDPLYPKIRPQINARFLRAILQESFLANECPRVLDYGAGNGLLSTLVGGGFAVENYDALNPDFDTLPSGPIDVIFSAEVVEHMPFPRVFVDDWSACLAELGCVIFSTKLQPSDIDVIRADWWYLGPRNGHVSFFTEKSLQTLCARAGLRYESLTEDWHIAYKNPGHRVDISTLQRNMALLPTGFIVV
jgi:2-polyprenyl-6-hydroxyphenyl methylase/3-demethylubiquinone-9 3-methyltransferase